MGGSPGYVHSGKTYNECPSCESQRRTNPDVTNFRIDRIEEGTKYMLIDVVYPNCTNYEGRKFMIIPRMTTIELLHTKKLDPHFSKDGGVIARFEPTPSGWAMGLLVLKGLP